jgi:hypothetical protein
MSGINEAVRVLSRVEDNLCTKLVSDFEDINPVLGFYKHVLRTYNKALMSIDSRDEPLAVLELKKINEFSYNGKKMYSVERKVKPVFKKRDLVGVSAKVTGYIGLLAEEDYTEMLKVFDSCKSAFKADSKAYLDDYHFLSDAFFFLSSVEYFHCAVIEARKENPFRIPEVSQELSKVFYSLGNVVSDVHCLIANYQASGIKS